MPGGCAAAGRSGGRSADASCPLHPLHREVDPARWCVTLQDLGHFEAEVRASWKRGDIPDNPESPNDFHDDPEVGPSIHQVSEHFIKPVTLEAGGMSWALMRNPRGVACDVFATHCWAEGVFEFSSKLQRMWPRGAKGLYCCFLANPQNADISELLGGPIDKSPFALALQEAKHLVVVPNRRVSVYSRLWCVFEAHVALEQKIPVILPWWPRLRDMFWPLFLGALAFLGPTVTLICLPLQDAYPQGFIYFLFAFPCVQTAYVLSRPLARMLPVTASLASLCVVGLEFGLWGWMLKAAALGHANLAQVMSAWQLHLPNLFFGIESARRATDDIVDSALRQEADELSFESVSHARCSYEQDEAHIRGAIEGLEMCIDQAIGTLMVVGRYSPEVVANLSRGMSPARARWGVSLLRLCIVCLFWVVLPVAAAFRDEPPQDYEDPSVPLVLRVLSYALTVIQAGLAVGAMPLVCRAGDNATFLVDALFWACTFQWIGLFIGSMIRRGGGWDRHIYEICLILMTWPPTFFACSWFYRGALVPGLRLRDRWRAAWRGGCSKDALCATCPSGPCGRGERYVVCKGCRIRFANGAGSRASPVGAPSAPSATPGAHSSSSSSSASSALCSSDDDVC